MSNSVQAAVLFTDIVGYSKMMDRDEKRAVKLLAEHDRIIEAEIAKNGGKVIKHIGDAIFARFDSPLAAATSTLEFQKKLQKRNQISRDEDKVVVRAGLHFGEVVERDGDLFGHDVNLGARIEAITEPGSICATAAVAEALDDNFLVREIGDIKLKNISEPQRVYKMYLNKDQFESESLSLAESFSNRGVQIVDIESYRVRDIFSTAFLQIRDVTGEDKSLCYGITEALIGDFQKIDQVRTPGLQETVRYADSDLDLKMISQRLKVDSVIEGTLKRDGNIIELSMSMFDSQSGDHTWNGKWRHKDHELKEIRGSIIKSLLEHYDMDVPEHVQKYLEHDLSKSSEAISCYYDALNLIYHSKGTDDLEKARDLFTKALKHDEGFVEARAQLGMTHNKLGYYEDAEREMEEARETADKNNLDQSIAYVYNIYGLINQFWYKYEKSIRYFDRALEIQVQMQDRITEAKILNNLASSQSQMGNTDKAIKLLEKSIEIRKDLEDTDSLAFPNATMGNIYFTSHNYSSAIESFKKAHAMFISQGSEYFAYRNEIQISESLVELGAYDEAKKYIETATPKSEDFDEPVMQGLLHIIQGRIYFHNQKYSEAIDSYTKANKIYLQYGDLIDRSLAVTFEMIYCLIELGELDKVKDEIKNMINLNKRVKFEDRNIQTKAIELLFKSCSQNVSSPEIDSVYKEMDQFFEDEDGFSDKRGEFYWLLAKAYKNIGEDKKSSECHAKAIDQVNKDSQEISGKDNQKSFLNNGLNQRILAPIEKYSKEDKKEESSCPKCGFNYQDGFKFCPSCGESL